MAPAKFESLAADLTNRPSSPHSCARHGYKSTTKRSAVLSGSGLRIAESDAPRKAVSQFGLDIGRLPASIGHDTITTDVIGTRSRIAEVLNLKRGLSIAMVRRLHPALACRQRH